MPSASKPFLSYDETIALLEHKGIIFSDKTEAKHFFRHIGYSHLKAYWLSVSENQFSEIIKLYRFDGELKILLTRIIGPIELSLRHAWIICLSDSKKKHDPRSYLDKSNYQDFAKSEEYFIELVTKSKLPFIKKYHATESKLPFIEKDHKEKPMPPMWKMAELLSFGGLSKTVSNLKSPEPIAKLYDLEKRALILILQRLVNLRNLCAHHNIVWNHREPKLIPNLSKSTKAAALRNSINTERGKPARLYNSLCFCFFLLQKIALKQDYAFFCQELQRIIASRPDCATLELMGFPAGWEAKPLWH